MPPSMIIRALSNAVSGLHSSQKRLAASSHNVANLLTDDFQPLRTVQSERRDGGSSAQVERAASPQPVNLAREFVSQTLASLQFRASLRTLDTAIDMANETTKIGRDR